MTKQEWYAEAERHERTAQEYNEKGDVDMAQHYWNKASACRSNADYARD